MGTARLAGLYSTTAYVGSPFHSVEPNTEHVRFAGGQSGFAGEGCKSGGSPTAAGQPGGEAAGRGQEAHGEQPEAEHCSQNLAAGLAEGGQAAPADRPLGD